MDKWYMNIPGNEVKELTLFLVTDEREELSMLQERVGGYVTAIAAKCGPHRLTLIVNEEGLPRRLPPNRRATRLVARPSLGRIVGDAVLVGRLNPSGEWGGLTEEEIQSVGEKLEGGRPRVEATT